LDDRVVHPNETRDLVAIADPDPAFSDPLDAFIDPRIRSAIERAYHAPISAKGAFSEILKDDTFLTDPVGHVALFADHGAIHARDVARQVLQVVDAIHGRLIPFRSGARLRWMKAYGVIIALLHDIGMIDPSPVGRAMHPEYAAQEILGSGFDEILAALWAADGAGIASRVVGLTESGAIGNRPAEAALREMLAMTLCHSKRKVPVDLLNDRTRLRRLMQIAATSDLHELHRRQNDGGGAAGVPPDGDRGFDWLELDSGPGGQIADDVVDTLRVLRCADALRQRGTLLKTSGQYEIFVDERTANAVYALRPDQNHLYLLEVADPISAGESNLSSCQLDAGANLRISFHHGQFKDQETVDRAAHGAARVVSGIQGDAIESFTRSDLDDHPGLTPAADLRILIEAPDDNPAFAGFVREQLRMLNPAAAERVRVVASLAAASPLERSRYLDAFEIDWDPARRRELLDRVALSGHRTERIDPVVAFREVRRIELKAGDVLLEAGTSSGFVYIPLCEGLRGRPLGGYESFAIPAWVPVGATGVIRGAIRNADVAAEAPVGLLAIPRSVFLDHWHFTHDQKSFIELFRNGGEARR
jgi:hypothetical protein